MDVSNQEHIMRRVALLMEVRDLLGESDMAPAPPQPAARGVRAEPAPPASAAVPAGMPPEMRARLAQFDEALDRLRAEIAAHRREPHAAADPAAMELARKTFDRCEALAGLLESAITSLSTNQEQLFFSTLRLRKRLSAAVTVSLLMAVAALLLAASAAGWLDAAPVLERLSHAVSALRGAILPGP